MDRILQFTFIGAVNFAGGYFVGKQTCPKPCPYVADKTIREVEYILGNNAYSDEEKVDLALKMLDR